MCVDALTLLRRQNVFLGGGEETSECARVLPWLLRSWAGMCVCRRSCVCVYARVYTHLCYCACVCACTCACVAGRRYERMQRAAGPHSACRCSTMAPHGGCERVLYFSTACFGCGEGTTAPPTLSSRRRARCGVCARGGLGRTATHKRQRASCDGVWLRQSLV